MAKHDNSVSTANSEVTAKHDLGSKIAAGPISLNSVREAIGEMTNGLGDLFQAGIGGALTRKIKSVSEDVKSVSEGLSNKKEIKLFGKFELEDKLTAENRQLLADELLNNKKAFDEKVKVAPEDTKTELQAQFDKIYNAEGGVYKRTRDAITSGKDLSLQEWADLVSASKDVRTVLEVKPAREILNEKQAEKVYNNAVKVKSGLPSDAEKEYEGEAEKKVRKAVESNEDTYVKAKAVFNPEETDDKKEKSKKVVVDPILEMGLLKLGLELEIAQPSEKQSSSDKKGKK